MDYICDHNDPVFDVTKSGGIIETDGAVFQGNGKAIHFIEKTTSNDGSANFIDNAEFIGREVVSSTPVDLYDERYYNGNTPFYPNYRVPWAGAANNHQRGNVGILIDNVFDLIVEDSEFEDIQYCIDSYDSRNITSGWQTGTYICNLLLGNSFVKAEKLILK